MAQNVLDYTYDPTGNELMDEYLPKMAENCLTNNSGIARPTYAVENTVWVDTSDDDTWRYKIYDGTSDIVLFELDNITKKINFPNITGVFRFKGSVATVSALPATGNLPGDVYNVIDGGANYAWNDSEWDKLSENLEWGRIVGSLSNQTDLQNALDSKQVTLVSGTNIKTINGISLLGSGDVNIDSLPSQTGQAGKFLTTNGTNASWDQVDALPSQTGQAGKFLTTNGTTASWETVSVTGDNKSITRNSNQELQTIGVINSRDSSTAVKTWTGTKAQYDVIVTKDPNTLYNITDDTDVSLTILEALYPVGSVYITTANTCPLSALISGSTWTQETCRQLVEKKEPTDNDPSWYNLYSDGWCVQGGFLSLTTADVNTPIDFIKTFADTNYTIVTTLRNNNTNAGFVNVDNTSGMTTSGTYVRIVHKSNSGCSPLGVFWQACGYTSTTTSHKQFRRTA